MNYSLLQYRLAGFLVKPAFLCLLAAVLLCLLSIAAVAQKADSKHNIDSIVGVKIGMSLVDAHEKLERLGSSGSRSEIEEEEKEEAGERKEAWTLRKTAFSSVALKANRDGKVVWVTGFVRPGQEIPFVKLGNPARASRANDSIAIWNVETLDGGYRIVAKGNSGKARVVYFLSLALPPMQ